MIFELNQPTLNNMEKTLLDEIAIAAMVKYMRKNNESHLIFADAPQAVARLSYAQAQAMLDERERRSAKRTDPEPVKSEPDWHNPAHLDLPDLPGEGWRFCVTGETEDPPFTEWYDCRVKKWRADQQYTGADLSVAYSYRINKPLPTTPSRP